PRWPRGDFVFSTTGKKPIGNFSNLFRRDLDRRMVKVLRAIARMRGENPADVRLPTWVVHDIRRTVRTRLSGLRVPSEVAELIVGHGKKGIERVYNLHEYEDEMREALAQWATKLNTIVNPPAPKSGVVVPLRV